MKSYEETMEILEAYDLVGSLRGAATLAGCDHHTVARIVAQRAVAGALGEPERAGRVIDPYREKVEEWVERSRGRIRADRAHRKLVGLGYRGSERTTRRAVAEAKATYAAGRRRVYRPSRGCGCSGTMRLARGSRTGRRRCFAPGWRGAATGW